MTPIPSLVLILDACIILDVVRFGSRLNSNPGHLEAVRELIEATTEAPATIEFLICDVIANEVTGHFDKIVDAERAELAAIAKRIEHLDRVAHAYGAQTASRVGGLTGKAWQDAYLAGASALARKVVEVAGEAPSLEEDRRRAFERVLGRVAPAKQGSSSSFDSILTEVALRVAGEREPRSTVLVSSNVRDFMEGSNLRDPLPDQFNEAGLLFARSWGEAFGLWLDFTGASEDATRQDGGEAD